MTHQHAGRPAFETVDAVRRREGEELAEFARSLAYHDHAGESELELELSAKLGLRVVLDHRIPAGDWLIVTPPAPER